MAAYFVDLDGTLFEFGTNNFLPGTQDFLNFIKENEHQLILTTRRSCEWEGNAIFSIENTLKALKELDIEYHSILFGIDSPRIVINDDGCSAINLKMNKGLQKENYEIGENNET